MRKPTENITAYMNEISKIDRLTPEEELELATLIREGTPEQKAAAKERLVCSNLRLVVKIAHDFKNYGLGFADLVAEGNLGLSVAADKYEPGHGCKFSWYAAWWIKQAIRKAIMWQSRIIRIPGASARRIATLAKARTSYITEHGHEPTNADLATLTGISEASVASLSRVSVDTVSMDDTVNDMSDTTFESMLAEEREVAAPDEYNDLYAALDTLTPVERIIVSNEYGLSGKPMSTQALCVELGLSPSAIMSKLSSALNRLRQALSDGSNGTVPSFL